MSYKQGDIFFLCQSVEWVFPKILIYHVTSCLRENLNALLAREKHWVIRICLVRIYIYFCSSFLLSKRAQSLSSFQLHLLNISMLQYKDTGNEDAEMIGEVPHSWEVSSLDQERILYQKGTWCPVAAEEGEFWNRSMPPCFQITLSVDSNKTFLLP
jgi:hypothetical protein